MGRANPELLQLDRYPFQHLITTRFADMDNNDHINNVALAAAFEDARFRFDHACGFRDTMGHLRVVIGAHHIDYVGEAFYPDPLTMFVGVWAIGNSSWTLGCLATQNGRACAFAKAVLVATDANGSAPLPPAFRQALESARIRMED